MPTFSDPVALVAQFANPPLRVDTFTQLTALGDRALPAAEMLFLVAPDPRVPQALEAALTRATDRRLRLHLERALSKQRS